MKSMKLNRLGGTISLSTLAAVAVMASQSSTSFAREAPCCCEVKRSVSSVVNRGYLSTPRGREEFPWLARVGTVTAAHAKTGPEAISALNSNRALAGSPRFLEEHPELLRGGKAFGLTTSPAVPAEVMKNAALVASPRTREEFPAILRSPGTLLDSDGKVQIAPLK